MGLAPVRYVDDFNVPTEDYPMNPNGSPLGIAGKYKHYVSGVRHDTTRHSHISTQPQPILPYHTIPSHQRNTIPTPIHHPFSLRIPPPPSFAL